MTRPVVLVHGYRDDATVFHRLAHALGRAGRAAHPVTLAPSDGRAPLEELAGQLQAYIDRSFPAEERLDFVGFSMGGVLVRYYLQRLGGMARTGQFVAVGTPHYGTWTAFASRRPAALQLRPGSRFLRDLAADVEQLAAVNLTSIWTPVDTMILPASSSALPVGENLPVLVPYHRALVTRHWGIRIIEQRLAGAGVSAERQTVG